MRAKKKVEEVSKVGVVIYLGPGFNGLDTASQLNQ